MDGQRFDEIARALGSGASRRRVLKGLIAGLAAVGFRTNRSYAQVSCEVDVECGPGKSCLGGTCFTTCLVETRECVVDPGIDDLPCCDGSVCVVQEGGEGLCTWPDACKRPGGPCIFGVPCCDGLSCLDGVCVEPCVVENDDCETNEDCCADLVCNAGKCDGSCVGQGVVCEIDDDCCTDLFCDSEVTGVCTQSPTCRTGGADCGDDAPCCDGLSCTEGICVDACAAETEVCETGDDCCDGLICVQEGGPGTCQLPGACQELDEGCSGVAPCCEGLSCIDNVCIADSAPEPEPEPTSPVTSLPNTGAGSSEDSSGVIGATAVIGAAAALLTAKKLLAQKTSEEA